MSSDRNTETDPARPKLSIQDRIAQVQRAIMRNRLVQEVFAVLDYYGNVDGGLLSKGLAFSALFAIIPAILAVVGVLGIVIDDPVKRQNAIDFLIQAIPPLESVAQTIVDTLANTSKVTTVIGLLGVIWGASGFYGALASAFRLLFPGPKTRDPIEQRIRGLVGVIVLVSAILAVVAFEAVMSVATTLLTIPGIDTIRVVGIVLTVVGSIAATFTVFLIVPPNAPSGRAAAGPALAFGGTIGLLTALFGVIGPLLVKGFIALGVIAQVFIALVWLNLVFQALLYGAAWAAIRRDNERRNTLGAAI
jgi:membrane protein